VTINTYRPSEASRTGLRTVCITANAMPVAYGCEILGVLEFQCDLRLVYSLGGRINVSHQSPVKLMDRSSKLIFTTDRKRRVDGLLFEGLAMVLDKTIR
jgi:hypothetical protein